VQTITAELARDLGLPDASGVLITRVEAGGPAEKAGLRPEDVILEVNRKPIYRLSDYYQALKSGKNHEPILLLVRRGDRVFYTAVQQKE
ncbi:MAG: PDZ domain-containing protein, partial [Nitrospinota bacterium]